MLKIKANLIGGKAPNHIGQVTSGGRTISEIMDDFGRESLLKLITGQEETVCITHITQSFLTPDRIKQIVITGENRMTKTAILTQPNVVNIVPI